MSQFHSRVDPRSFSSEIASDDPYLADPLIQKLVTFFEQKGLQSLKDEDRREQWYDDWIAYQSRHRLYAALLAPAQYSSDSGRFDLLRLTRAIEVFGYLSPAHGYSLQVTFLGLFAILMGDNAALKQEAVAALEQGRLLALGVSEKGHGADLFSNEFTLTPAPGEGRFLANGSKYYIGNANCASMVSILARKKDPVASGERRAPFVIFALRPALSPAFQNVRKIPTLGIRAAYVGSFDVVNHELPQSDIIAQGRKAWDALFGTITLGKLFLGFGSIGIAEHAFFETRAHLHNRTLYDKPALDMPHLADMTALAWTRLAAMKLYATRALDYLQCASNADRRYLLFSAVQKVRVTTEAVKVIDLLSQCAGARGLESDTYLEMARRDAALIPVVEGSTHVNLALTAQFVPRYFSRPDDGLPLPPSITLQADPPSENPYLFQARTGAVSTICFADCLAAYQPHLGVPSVRLFTRQIRAFRWFLLANRLWRKSLNDPQLVMALGETLGIIAYAQLIAENVTLHRLDPPICSAIFHTLVADLSAAALSMQAMPQLDTLSRLLLNRCVMAPRTPASDWQAVAARMR